MLFYFVLCQEVFKNGPGELGPMIKYYHFWYSKLAKEGFEGFNNENRVSVGYWVGLSKFRELIYNC